MQGGAYLCQIRICVCGPFTQVLFGPLLSQSNSNPVDTHSLLHQPILHIVISESIYNMQIHPNFDTLYC